jgi:hypothetical protein
MAAVFPRIRTRRLICEDFVLRKIHTNFKYVPIWFLLYLDEQ